VVLGKLAATSLNCLYAALAVVPMLALPLLMGAWPWASSDDHGPGAGQHAFPFPGLGMAGLRPEPMSRQAMAATFVLLLFLTGLLPALGLWHAAAVGSSQVGRGWLLPASGSATAVPPT